MKQVFSPKIRMSMTQLSCNMGLDFRPTDVTKIKKQIEAQNKSCPKRFNLGPCFGGFLHNGLTYKQAQ